MSFTITVYSINDEYNLTNVVFIHHFSILLMCFSKLGGHWVSKKWRHLGPGGWNLENMKVDDKGEGGIYMVLNLG